MQMIFRRWSANLFILGALLFGFVPSAQAHVLNTLPPVWEQNATFDHEFIGQSYAVAVDANEQYAYFGSGSRIYSADIHTNPGHIMEIHETDTLHGGIRQIILVGNYAYVAAEEAGLVILDVSIPFQPHVLGSFQFTNTYAFHVQVANQRAYVAATNNGIAVINVSNPANPTQVGSSYKPGASFQALKLVGNTLYALDYYDGLYVYDVSNPNSMVLLQNIPLTVLPYPYSMTINGNYAYAGDAAGNIAIIDLATKAVTKIKPAGNIVEDLDTTPGKLYLAVDSLGICTLNILDFGNITDVCSFPPGPFLYPKNVHAMASGRIYAAFSDGLRIINPSPGTPGGYTFDVREPRDGALLNGKIYVTSRDGLSVVDASTGSLLGKLSNPPSGGLNQLALSVQGSIIYAIASDNLSNIYVFDASNPASITQLGSPFIIQNNLYPGKIQVVGSTIYIIGNTSTTGYLYVINMANPAALSSLAQITLPGNSNGDLSIMSWASFGTIGNPGSSHRVALITGYAQGVDIVDISNLATPIFHSIPKPPNLIWSVTSSPDMLFSSPAAIYVGTGSGIMTYSYPNLVYQGTFTNTYTSNMAINGNYLVGIGGAGIIYYSMSNPLAPTQVAFADIPGLSSVIVPGGPFQVMGIDQGAGLQIVNLQTNKVRLPIVKR